ncbi:hypothetical protein QYE76_058174 [Lolium multiflorum]|uniref:Uncharacterized protein n=1 Tax=Lolium multiflorum TaxID=4521 RepID=A0AAD8WS75_LOLMU|nr:hypothetical protein QYE76_058174 [Lolium multiflorum]
MNTTTAARHGDDGTRYCSSTAPGRSRSAHVDDCDPEVEAINDGAPEGGYELVYEEPDLTGGVEGVDYGIVYRPDDTEIMASPSISFNQFLEKELKSNGSNFTDWFRHVIFLNGGNLQYVLDAPLGRPPPPAVSEDEKNVYETRVIRYSQVQCANLCSLEAELQKRFEHHDPYELVNELKTIFETHAVVESYEASKHFFGCMMEEGSSVSEQLQELRDELQHEDMNKELPELFSMLKSAEVEIKKENQVLMVNKTTGFKQGKPNNKGNFKKGGKKAAAPPEPKAGPKPDTVCYYCKEKGHFGSVIAPNTWLI